jgi:hypothetical protein
MAFCFPQQLSTFFNGFPIFLNNFPLSEKSKKIYLRRQVYKRSLFKLRISRHLLPKLRNSHYNVYISPTTMGPVSQNSELETFIITNLNPIWKFFQIRKITKTPAAHTHRHDN